MSLLEYAKNELDLIGLTENSDDEMNIEMRNHILHMVEEFANEGHSGFSANYAINILSKILRYEPVTPLTGLDDEWDCHQDERTNGVAVYQNKRCSRIFKREDRFNGQPYDSSRIIFWEWYTTEEGKKVKTYFQNSDSAVAIEFPYVPEHDYVEAYSE